MKSKKLFSVLIIILLFGLIGCAGSTGAISSPDPIERGLSYIACAIVTHGVLNLFT